MDTRGTIREYELHPGMKEVPIGKPPNPNCKDCYGRGFVRYIIENICETVPCHCTKKLVDSPYNHP